MAKEILKKIKLQCPGGQATLGSTDRTSSLVNME